MPAGPDSDRRGMPGSTPSVQVARCERPILGEGLREVPGQCATTSDVLLGNEAQSIGQLEQTSKQSRRLTQPSMWFSLLVESVVTSPAGPD